MKVYPSLDALKTALPDGPTTPEELGVNYVIGESVKDTVELHIWDDLRKEWRYAMTLEPMPNTDAYQVIARQNK